MQQHRDEPIRSLGARVRAQAGVCIYVLNCDCGREISYNEHILRDVVVQGLVNSEIQLDLLSGTNQNMTLEDVFQFVEKKETGKRSANCLLQSQGVEIITSQYKRNQGQGIKDVVLNKSDPWGFCGKCYHGKNSLSHLRKQYCQTDNSKCNYCHKLHHHESVCRLKQKNKGVQHSTSDSEMPLFDSLCTACTSQDIKIAAPLTLHHHVFDNLSERWLKKSLKPPPFVTLTASVAHDDYSRLGHSLTAPTSNTQISAIAVTGCQSCLMGVKLLKNFGHSMQNLIPVWMKMHAANNDTITIFGAIIFTIRGKSELREVLTTKQIVYVTHDSDRFFLSCQACIELVMISDTFPTVGDVEKSQEVSLCTTEGTTTTNPSSLLDDTCSPTAILLEDTSKRTCLQQELPPPKLSALPFPATKDNRQKLEDWLKSYYASSTFNTCSHQLLPMMNTIPLCLIDRP